MKKKIVYLLLFVSIAATGIFLFNSNKSRIVDYLSVNSPVDADYLIVEGWVSDSSLAAAVSEYKKRGYAGIILTGGPLESYVLMPEEDLLEFRFLPDSLEMSTGDTLFISLRGTAVNDTFPHYRFFANGQLLVKGFTSEKWKEYFYIAEKRMKIGTFSVTFDNDQYEGSEDRNLFIEYLRIGDKVLPSRCENCLYYKKENKKKRIHPGRVNIHSLAEYAGNKITSMGVQEGDIVILPAPSTSANRTFNSALAVRRWVKTTGIEDLRLNIFSENIHARRSWLLYKYALKDITETIGIISGKKVPEKLQNIRTDNQNILRELSGNLYYKFIFNKKKHLKEAELKH